MATTYFNQQIQAVDGILFRLRCYRDPQRIRNDVLDILKNIPSLQPRSGTLPSARASTTQILYLAGTVPIYYSGNQYNIPVSIYLIEAYPFSPPVPYVTPTPDMIIKPKHRHVDSAGMVYLPYLSGWNPNTSNLVGLSQVLIKVFTEDPPVRAAPKVTSPTPSPANQYPTGTTNTYPGSSTSGYPGSSSGGYPPYPSSSTGTPYPSGTTTPGAYPYPTGNQSPYGQPPALPPKSGYGTPTQPYENPADVAKRNVIRNVTEKLQAAFNEFNSKTTKEIDDLMAVTSAEEDKARRLDKEKNDLSSNKVQIDSDIEDLSKKFEDLTQWLEHNDSTTKPLDIDTITEPRDPISKQLLTLVAEDATIEDTLYYLEKSLGNENMNTDAFLKAYRNLATEQFMKRATIKKIHEKQRGL